MSAFDQLSRPAVEDHYSRPDLLQALIAGLQAAGKTPDTATLSDLSPIDEFHIGGRTATEMVLTALDLDPSSHLLDIGCGLGGTARLAAQRHGCRVSGLDLTRDYVEAGNTLSAWVGLDHLISLYQGSALAMPFAPARFDAASMLHVGMNIRDKMNLFAEIARLLRPGALLAVYDVMRMTPGEIAFPVPWSDRPETCSLAYIEAYRHAAGAAGFQVIAERNLGDFARDHFAGQARQSGGLSAPQLGLQILMGERRVAQVQNMQANLRSGLIAPVLLLLRSATEFASN